MRDAEGGGAVAAVAVAAQAARDDDIAVVVGDARVAGGVAGGVAGVVEVAAGEVLLPLPCGVRHNLAGAGASAGASCMAVGDPGSAVTVGIAPIGPDLVRVVVVPGEAASVVVWWS